MKEPHLVDCSSFYQFIPKYWKNKTGNDRPLHRLCSLARKQNVKKVVVEELQTHDDDELYEEVTELSAWFNSKVPVEAYRFTFVANPIKDIEALKDLPHKDYLSSAILVNAKLPKKKISYLLRSIVRTPSFSFDGHPLPLLNNYLHVGRDFECNVRIGKSESYSYNIAGSYFSQQNGVTSVCAHSGLKMIINNYAASGNQVLITTKQINNIINRTQTKVGLTMYDLEKILKTRRLKTIQQNFFAEPNLDYAEYLHRLVESSCPALLVFSTDRTNVSHVVLVIGHTLNSDMWHPEAEIGYQTLDPLRYSAELKYQPAAKWMDNLIIHDDNLGMYLCLSVDSLRRTTLPMYDPSFRAYVAIGVVPCSLPTPSREAEMASSRIVRNLLNNPNLNRILRGHWLKLLRQRNSPQLIVRTALFTRQRYKDHLTRCTDFEGKRLTSDQILWITSGLPKQFWLCEITIPDLYTTNKTKLIDVLYDCTKKATSKPRDMQKKCIFIRFPGLAIHFKRKPPELIPLSVRSHYPLFRVREQNQLLEW